MFPKLVEAEKVIGYEFAGRGGPTCGGAHHARDGGRFGGDNATATGAWRELAEGEGSRCYVGTMPEVDVVSPLGWNDAFVAGYAVRLLEGDSPAECLRFGLGCGAANLMTLRSRRVLAGRCGEVR